MSQTSFDLTYSARHALSDFLSSRYPPKSIDPYQFHRFIFGLADKISFVDLEKLSDEFGIQVFDLLRASNE